MTTDILGVRKHPRSREITTLISNALLAECEGDMVKESEIRTQLEDLLSSEGTIPSHRDWEATITIGNQVRLERLVKNQRLQKRGIQVSKISAQTILFTHNLAHLNHPDGTPLNCSVCEWSPLESAGGGVAQALMGFNPADYEDDDEEFSDGR